MPASTLLFSRGSRNQQDKAWAVWGLFRVFFWEQVGGETHIIPSVQCICITASAAHYIRVELTHEGSSKHKFRTARAVLLCWEHGSRRALEPSSSRGFQHL